MKKSRKRDYWQGFTTKESRKRDFGQAFTIDLPSDIWAGRDDKFASRCSANGHVVAVPCNAKKILVVDPASPHAFAIELPSGINAQTGDKFLSSCSVNGQVVAVPFKAKKILVVDPQSREAFTIDLPSGIKADRRDRGKFACSCVVNGQVVAVPFDAEKILVVDPLSRQAFAIALPPAVFAKGRAKFRTSAVVNGQVVAVPNDAEEILVVDPASREAFTIELPLDIDEERLDKFKSSCSVNGQVVAVPYSAEQALVVDPTSRQAFAISAGGWQRFRSSCLLNGQVVAGPCNDRKQTLVVDPSSRRAFTRFVPSGNPAEQRDFDFLPSCSVHGHVVAVPCDAAKIRLLCSRSLRLGLPTSDVHTTPQFVDLVAALLSFWIYTDDPEPPTLEHALFEVHAWGEPTQVGRPVRLRGVIADLPVGKVFFIVFRRTSGLLDFENWNLEPVYVSDDFFASRGATYAMACIRLWIECLSPARFRFLRENGVKRIVFAGHSVGGVYAQLCLEMWWRTLQANTPRRIYRYLSSFDIQCITFGAPMVFGGSSKEASQFKDFAKERAVNYIHADDPCPRAWGALNLRDFVEKATVAVNKGLMDPHGSIKGSSSPKVVEEMATKFLKRPDFNVTEDLAKKYEHFVPLRILSSKKEPDSWKDFQLTPECFENHSVLAYVNKLFDAFDASRPECHIHRHVHETPESEHWPSTLGA